MVVFGLLDGCIWGRDGWEDHRIVQQEYKEIASSRGVTGVMYHMEMRMV